jgi:hypothetical protein
MSALGHSRRFWHVRNMSGYGGNLGSADCPVLTVAGIGERDSSEQPPGPDHRRAGRRS